MKYILGIATAFLALNTALAAPAATPEIPTAVVNKNTCSTLARTTHPFILVLDNGDILHDAINQCAKDAQLLGASITGLGQVHNPVLAYFTNDPKDAPTTTAMEGFYELAGMNGDVTNNEGKYYTHIHAVLADHEFHGIAGHVNHALVGLTVEVTIIPLSGTAQRTVDPHTGFGPIVH